MEDFPIASTGRRRRSAGKERGGHQGQEFSPLLSLLLSLCPLHSCQPRTVRNLTLVFRKRLDTTVFLLVLSVAPAVSNVYGGSRVQISW